MKWLATLGFASIILMTLQRGWAEDQCPGDCPTTPLCSAVARCEKEAACCPNSACCTKTGCDAADGKNACTNPICCATSCPQDCKAAQCEESTAETNLRLAFKEAGFLSLLVGPDLKDVDINGTVFFEISPSLGESQLRFGLDCKTPEISLASSHTCEETTQVLLAPIEAPLTFSKQGPTCIEKLTVGAPCDGNSICREVSGAADATDKALSPCSTFSETNQAVALQPVPPSRSVAVTYAETTNNPSEEMNFEVEPFLGQEADELDQLFGPDAFQKVQVNVPAKAILQLMVERATLATRLEMTERMMDIHLAGLEKIHALTERNAALTSRVAAAEAKQHQAESLAAKVTERADAALQIANSRGNKPSNLVESKEMERVQEDLSNIRRQIALLRKPQPVPFAPSRLGVQRTPYVPTAHAYPAPVESLPLEEDDVESSESNADESDLFR